MSVIASLQMKLLGVADMSGRPAQPSGSQGHD